MIIDVLNRGVLRGKTYIIVEDGFQVMAPAHYNSWQTVTDTQAVLIENTIYCTEVWKKRL